MTTPRACVLVSRTAMTILTLVLGACASAPGRVASEGPAPIEAGQVSLRFDNQSRSYVHVYLVGETREWLLGRVEPGAVATLRIPDESLESDPGFVQLAVLAEGHVALRVAREPGVQLTIAQPASSILARQWRFAEGQLTSRGRNAAR
jgi:hypothetical protein